MSANEPAGCRLTNSRPFRRQHQLDDFFRDIRLEPFSMPFVDPNHIGNDVPIAAFGVHEHPRSAGSRLEALHAAPCGLPKPRIPHVAGFRVDDIRTAGLRLAAEFLRPERVVRQSRCGQLVLA
jgi:hypothetical protein